MKRFILTAALVFSFAVPARAMSIDVSDDVIKVTTGFNGTAMTVFGTQDKPGTVVIVLEGPPKAVTIRKKSRVLGLWTNTDSREYHNVPGFYQVAASGPLSLVASDEVLKQNRIGIANLPIVPDKGADKADTAEFTSALFKMQQDHHLFVDDIAPLAYPGPMLFKAHFKMPALVPPGQYKVSAYLFQDGHIIEQDTAPFVIIPEGLSANMRIFATQNGLLYGLTGLLMALFAGWLATVLLKRD